MSYEAVLLQRIVKDAFGTAPALVVCLLLQKQSCLVSELLEMSKLDWLTLQNSLLVLYRHGAVCLEFEKVETPGGTGAAASAIIKYALDKSAVLARLRYGRYLLTIEQRYGRAGRYILLQLLKNGMLTANTCIEGAFEDFKQLEPILNPSETETLGQKSIPQDMQKHRLRDLFKQMVMDSFIAKVANMDERVQLSKTAKKLQKEPPKSTSRNVSAQQQQEQAAKAKTPRGPPKRQRATRGAQSLSSQAVVTSGSDSALLFPDAMTVGSGSDDLEPAQKRSKTFGSNDSLRVSAEQEEEDMAEQSSSVASSGDAKTVYQINLDKMNIELFKRLIEGFVALRWGNNSNVRMIVRALLTTVRRQGFYLTTQPLGFDQIAGMVVEAVQEENKELQRRGEAVRLTSPDSKQLFTVLDSLTRHSDRMIRSVKREVGNSFELDWEHTRDYLRRRLAKQLITVRFGEQCARVFALVLDADTKGAEMIRQQLQGGTDAGQNDTAMYLRYSRFWSDQEVSELGLMSLAAARRNLCLLTNAGLLRSHFSDVVGCIAPTATTPNMKHSWVYGAREEDALQTLHAQCAHTALNILERKAAEVEKLQKLILKATDLTDEEQFEQTCREMGEDVLEASISAVDQALVILREL